MTEILLSPQKLSDVTGVPVAQIRALMTAGQLEFVQISPRKQMLTFSAWQRFQQAATVCSSGARL